MIDTAKVRQGMPVYGPDGQEIGTVERVGDNHAVVGGQEYGFDSFDRYENNRLYLRQGWDRNYGGNASAAGATGMTGTSNTATTGSGRTGYTGQGEYRSETVAPTGGETVAAQNEVRVPVREERLQVEKREAELGEVAVHKHVTEEQQSVPVDLTREEVHVDKRDVEARPASEADLANAFQEGTIRVPVRGEEAYATKTPVVTGEVVIEKERTTERQQVSDTVRREHVDVDNDVDESRAGVVRGSAGDDRTAGNDRGSAFASGTTQATRDATFASGSTQTGTTRDVDRTSGNRAAGTANANVNDPASAGTYQSSTSTASGFSGFSAGMLRQGMGVYGADGQSVGRVKEVGDGEFLVDIPSARDVWVPFDAVAGQFQEGIKLNVDSGDVGNMGWRNPSLF